MCIYMSIYIYVGSVLGPIHVRARLCVCVWGGGSNWITQALSTEVLHEDWLMVSHQVW